MHGLTMESCRTSSASTCSRRSPISRSCSRQPWRHPSNRSCRRHLEPVHCARSRPDRGTEEGHGDSNEGRDARAARAALARRTRLAAGAFHCGGLEAESGKGPRNRRTAGLGLGLADRTQQRDRRGSRRRLTGRRIRNSVADVVGRDAVVRAVEHVIASFDIGMSENQVFVQPMLKAIALAGVAFTRDPNGGGPCFLSSITTTAQAARILVTSGAAGALKTFFCLKSRRDRVPPSLSSVADLLPGASIATGARRHRCGVRCRSERASLSAAGAPARGHANLLRPHIMAV